MFEEHLGEICSWDVLCFPCLQSHPQQNCCAGTEGSQQRAEVVQRRAGDAFSLTRPMSLGGARGTVLGACFWHLTALLCSDQTQALSCSEREQTNGQVSCGNSAVGAFLVPYCRLLDRKSLLPIWACRVICCLTACCAESSNPVSFIAYAITHTGTQHSNFWSRFRSSSAPVTSSGGLPANQEHCSALQESLEPVAQIPQRSLSPSSFLRVHWKVAPLSSVPLTWRIQIEVTSMSMVVLSPLIIPSPRQSRDWLAAASGHCAAVRRGILRVERNETVSDCLPWWNWSWKLVLCPVLCCFRAGFGANWATLQRT